MNSNPFPKTRPVNGHNIDLDKKPKQKSSNTTIIDLKKTLRLVKSYVSLYHCAWLLIILLLQLCVLLIFLNSARRGTSPPPTPQQHHDPSASINLQQPQLVQHHHHHHHHHHHPLLDDDAIQRQEALVAVEEEEEHQVGNKLQKDDGDVIVDHQLEYLPPPDDHVHDEEDADHNSNTQKQVIIQGQLVDNPQECKYGKVYVYDDLPPIFNKQLVVNCDDLDPWKSKCPAVSNHGFGPTATTTLGGTILMPQELAPSWWWTDMFSGEIIYHNRMSSYRCRTKEPESAKAFYVPFYAGLAVSKYLFTNYTAKERDRPCLEFLRWMKEQPYWKRYNGSDHFLMLGRMTWDFRRTDYDWGTRFLLMPEMRNMLRLSVERDRRDTLEISVPYPTGFHPRSASEIQQWQQFVWSRNRTSLFTFVGAKRGKVKNDFRGLLLDHCRSESDACKLVDCEQTPCSDGSSAVMEAFLQSDFCLQPRGDSDTRKSTFDCMLSGSIPVFFWEGSFRGQWELFLSSEPESFSVFIDRKQVRNGTSSVRRVLEEGYGKQEIQRLRDKIIDLIPRFLYAFPNEGLGNDAKDAFDIAIEGVLQKIIVQNPTIE